jgi:hypothetical protein
VLAKTLERIAKQKARQPGHRTVIKGVKGSESEKKGKSFHFFSFILCWCLPPFASEAG